MLTLAQIWMERASEEKASSAHSFGLRFGKKGRQRARRKKVSNIENEKKRREREARKVPVFCLLPPHSRLSRRRRSLSFSGTTPKFSILKEKLCKSHSPLQPTSEESKFELICVGRKGIWTSTLRIRYMVHGFAQEKLTIYAVRPYKRYK